MTAVTKTLLASASVLILTAMHHWYGAIIYATPWRHHVVLIAAVGLAVLLLLYGGYRWRPYSLPGKAALWLFLLVAMLVPVGWIGMFEGGYNHLLKNLLFFAGASESMLTRLYPAPIYAMPDDFWFEFTGVIQFFLGLLAACHVIGTVRAQRGRGAAG